MKKILATMAAVSALATAAPAVAQFSNGYQQQNGYQNGVNAGGNLAVRIDRLQARLQAGVQSGAISRQEAVPLRQQLRQLTQLERQYSVNGLNQRERADLQQRMRSLRQQIRAADGGNQARWDGYDREDGFGRYERNGDFDRDDRFSRSGDYDRDDRMDRNNDGYDDRDYDRDGRWDDDVDNGSYQQQPARGGLGGIIDSVIGGGGLRVGQRASGNLYGVPNEYRRQYPDGNGSYFRSDGRQIYQIDARSDTVVRIYPMNR